MLEEAIDAIVNLGVEAKKPIFQTCPAEPPHVYFLDGHRHEAAPAPKQYTAADLSMVIEMAGDMEESEVFYYRGKVVMFFDRDTRRERVEMRANHSDQFAEIAKWDSSNPVLTQKELLLILRTKFKRTISDSIPAAIRQLKWQSLAVSEGTVEPTKVSIGKRIEAEVSGRAAIPEEIAFDVPIFEPPFVVRSKIVVALEPLVEKEAFQLIPLAGEVARAHEEGDTYIGERLRERLGDRVFYGSPSLAR